MEASESVSQLSKDLVVKEKELAVASVKADKVNKCYYLITQTYYSGSPRSIACSIFSL